MPSVSNTDRSVEKEAVGSPSPAPQAAPLVPGAPGRGVAEPSSSSGAHDFVGCERLVYAPGLMVLGRLPRICGDIYWALKGVPEERRIDAAISSIHRDSPLAVARAFGIRNGEALKKLVSAPEVVRSRPLDGLEAAVALRVVDRDTVLMLASEVLRRPFNWYHRRIPELVRQLGLSENDRFEVARAAAEKRPFVLLQKLERYEILDLEKRVALAKAIVAADQESRSERSCLPLLHKLGPFDAPTWLELAKLSATHNPFAFARDVAVFGVTDEQQLRELAFRAAECSGPVFEEGARVTIARYVHNFGLSDQDDLLKVALLCAAVSGGDTARFIQCFGLTGKYDHLRVALEAASSPDGTYAFLGAFDKFGIESLSQRRAVGTRFALANGWLFTADLNRFGFDTFSDRRALARGIAEKVGLPGFDSPVYAEVISLSQDRVVSVEKFFGAYGFKPSEVRGELLDLAAVQKPLTAVRALHDLGLLGADQVTYLRRIAGASPEGLSAITQLADISLQGGELRDLVVLPALRAARMAFQQSRDPKLLKRVENILEGVVAHRTELNIPISPGILAEGPLISMIMAMRRLEQVSPLVRFSTWDLKDIAIPAVGQPLAAAAFFLAEPEVAAMGEGMRTREALRICLGMHEIPIHSLSDSRLARLYEVIGSAESNRGLRLEYQLTIAPDVWEHSFKNALDLLTASSVLWKLRQKECNRERIVVTPENLSAVEARLSQEIEREFAHQFDLQSGEGAVELQRRWGDLTPLTVLLARFKGGRSVEVPVLRDITRKILDGSFHDWKYARERGQLTGMTDTQVAAWRENPFRVGLFGAEDAKRLTDDSQLRLAMDIFERNVLRHIPESHVEVLGADLPSVTEATRRASLSEAQFAKEVRSLMTAVREVKTLLDAGQRSSLFAYLKRFNGIKRGLPVEFGREKFAQVVKDLGSIRDAVKERTVDSQRRYLVFSTVTDDPKLLLTVGDLVNTASCQNYKTGSFVETLPAYTIDSNIKVMLSFVLAEGLLRSHFKVPRNEPFDLTGCNISFDAPRLKLTVTDPGGVSGEFALGKAVSRRIIRLGRRVSDGAPTAVPEARYHQFHAITSHIEAEQMALLDQFRASCGLAAPKGQLEFPASSNPAGVYSDLGGGRKMGAFKLVFKGLVDSADLGLPEA